MHLRQAAPPRFLGPEYEQHREWHGPATLVLASPGIRLAARLIDAVVVLLSFGLMFGVLVALDPALLDTGDSLSRVTIVSLVTFGNAVLFFYEPVFTSTKGGTPGKLLLGIRVVRTSDGSRPSFGRALGRWLSQFLMSLIFIVGLLNVLWLLWDRPLYQCLHDKVASTAVVRRPQ